MSEINANDFFEQLRRQKEAKSLYKEACNRYPGNPGNFISFLYGNGEIAESELLEEYIISHPKLVQEYIENN